MIILFICWSTAAAAVSAYPIPLYSHRTQTPVFKTAAETSTRHARGPSRVHSFTPLGGGAIEEVGGDRDQLVREEEGLEAEANACRKKDGHKIRLSTMC